MRELCRRRKWVALLVVVSYLVLIPLSISANEKYSADDYYGYFTIAEGVKLSQETKTLFSRTQVSIIEEILTKYAANLVQLINLNDPDRDAMKYYDLDLLFEMQELILKFAEDGVETRGKTKNEVRTIGNLMNDCAELSLNAMDISRWKSKQSIQKNASLFMSVLEYACEKQRINSTEELLNINLGIAGTSQNSKPYACEECKGYAAFSLTGISGETEYYCYDHLVELIHMMDRIGL